MTAISSSRNYVLQLFQEDVQEPDFNQRLDELLGASEDLITEIEVSKTLHNRWLTDSTMQVVAKHCRNLERLDLSGCSELTDRSLKLIAEKNPKLKKIDLNSCKKITDASVGAFAANCPDLEYVDLCETQITDDSLVSLRDNCLNIRIVRIGDCQGVLDPSSIVRVGSKIEKLFLGMLSVDDYDVIEVATHCRDLQKLDIVGECLDDDSYIQLVQELPKLRTLICSLADDTDSSSRSVINRLQELKPRLKIC
jgi:hypothetical protein